MKRVVNKLKNSTVEVICDIDEQAWKEAQQKAFAKLAGNLEIKGFRKGKVPTDIAKKHIDMASVFNEGVNMMLQPTFDEILKEENLQPFARPSVDVTKVSDTELQMKFHIVLAPEVKLGKYKGLAIKQDAVKVEEKEIDEAIEKLIAQNASLVSKEGEAKKGDTVVMDFVGSVDGKEFDGGKADNYSLELGSNQFVPGFEDQLIGHKAGEDVEVNVTFPTQYVPELAGKKALFKCKIHEVKEKVLPKLDEELIKDLNLPDVKDEASLREQQKKQLAQQKESKAHSDALNKVLDKITSEATVEIANEILDEEVEGMKKNMEEQVKQRGLTLEQYYQITGQSEKEVEMSMKIESEKNLRTILCMEEIAKVEGLDVTDEDVEKEMKNIADMYKMPFDKVKEILSKDLNRMKAELRQRKIESFLTKENII